MVTILLATMLTTADPEWGTAKDGVAARLLLVTEKPAVGSSVKLKLEVKNTGDAAHGYNDQQTRVNNSLEVKGPDGKAVPYIATSFQTSGQGKQLKPGATVTIYADFDLAEQYLIDKPGKYTVKAVSRGGLPASNELVIDVVDGKLEDGLKLFAAFHKAAPQGWRASRYDNSITLSNSPTRLKADVASVTVYFTKTKESKQANAEYVAETKLGHAWLQASSPKTAERWPEYAKFVREKIDEFKK